PILPEPTRDLDVARKAIDQLPPPGGGCNWPLAIQYAYQTLQSTQRPQRDIILLGDGQKQGWADDFSLNFWKNLAAELPDKPEVKVGVYAINLAPKRSEKTPSWALDPLRPVQAKIGLHAHTDFQTNLFTRGLPATQMPPRWPILEID